MIARLDLYTRCILMHASLSSLARRSAWSTHASKAKSCKKCLCHFKTAAPFHVIYVRNKADKADKAAAFCGKDITSKRGITFATALPRLLKVTAYLSNRAGLCAQSFLGGQSKPFKSMEIPGPFEACSPSRLFDLKSPTPEISEALAITKKMVKPATRVASLDISWRCQKP